MKPTAVLVLVLSAATGCSSVTPPGGGDWSNWDNTLQMLPSGFPFPVREEIVTVGSKRFWVFDYDLSGDAEADLRVWYLVRRFENGGFGDRVAVVRNPYRVERLKLGLVAVISKLDYGLGGRVEEIRQQVDGEMRTVWVK